jgi:hypothetical protein
VIVEHAPDGCSVEHADLRMAAGEAGRDNSRAAARGARHNRMLRPCLTAFAAFTPRTRRQLPNALDDQAPP